jgi:hypothetical protein
MSQIARESLYGLWITYLMEFEGKPQITDIRYYKYQFNRNGIFDHITHEGFTVTKDSRQRKWDVVHETRQGKETVITLNGDHCYRVLSFQDNKLVIQVLSTGLIYHLARQDNYTSTLLEAAQQLKKRNMKRSY